MPTTYTESKCDACPRACRAGVFMRNEGGDRRPPAPHACPSGITPAWVVESFDKDRPPDITLDRVTQVTAVHGGTMLLGCEDCSAHSPCLFEVTGPAEKLPCFIFDMPGRAKWHRVTS